MSLSTDGTAPSIIYKNFNSFLFLLFPTVDLV
jgi:hypothetical protein